MANTISTYSTFDTSAFNFNPQTAIGMASMHAEHITNAYRMTASADLVGEWPANPKKGHVVNVSYPFVPEVGDYIDGPITVEDVGMGQVPVTVEFYLSSFHQLRGDEEDLDLGSFTRDILAPQVTALAEQLDMEVCKKGELVYNTNPATLGTPAGITALSDLQYPMDAWDNNGAPTGPRFSLLGFSTYNGAATSDDFARANYRGDNGRQFATGEFLQTSGIDHFKTFGVTGTKSPKSVTLTSTNKHTAGGYVGAIAINGAVAAGATTMALDGGAINETLTRGELFKVAGVDGTFVVTADATADGAGAIAAVTFSPAAPAGGFPDDALLTLSGTHYKNLFLSPGAIVAVTLPPSIPPGQAGAQVRAPGGFSFTWLAHNREATSGVAGYSFSTYVAVQLIRPEWASVHPSAS